MQRERPHFDEKEADDNVESHEGRPNKRRNWKTKWMGEECDYCVAAKSTERYNTLMTMMDSVLDVKAIDYWSLVCLCSPNVHAVMDTMRCSLTASRHVVLNLFDGASSLNEQNVFTIWYYCIVDKEGKLGEWLRSRTVSIPGADEKYGKSQEDVLFDCFFLGGSFVSKGEMNGETVWGLAQENNKGAVMCTCEGSAKTYYAIGIESDSFKNDTFAFTHPSQREWDVCVLKDVLGLNEEHLEGVDLHRIFGLRHFKRDQYISTIIGELESETNDYEGEETFHLSDIVKTLKRHYPSEKLNEKLYGSLFYDFASERLFDDADSYDSFQIVIPGMRAYARIGLWPLFNSDPDHQTYSQKNVILFQPGVCADSASCIFGPRPSAFDLTDRLELKGFWWTLFTIKASAKKGIYVRTPSYVRSCQTSWDVTTCDRFKDLRVREFLGLGDPEERYPLSACILGDTLNLTYLKTMGANLNRFDLNFFTDEFGSNGEYDCCCWLKRKGIGKWDYVKWFDEENIVHYIGLLLICDLHAYQSKVESLEACYTMQYKNYLLVERNDL